MGSQRSSTNAQPASARSTTGNLRGQGYGGLSRRFPAQATYRAKYGGKVYRAWDGRLFRVLRLTN